MAKYRGIIYKRVCKITGKVYIGQTIDERARQARWRSLKNCYTSKNSKIDNARNKYGIENFDYEILFTVVSNKKKVFRILDKKEKYFIKKFDSFLNGYNSTSGGNKHPQRFHRNLENNYHAKEIIVYTIYGELVGKFNSCRIAGLELNLKKNILQGSAGGLYTITDFKYLVYYVDTFSEEKLMNDLDYVLSLPQFKAVAQINPTTGEIVETYRNISYIDKNRFSLLEVRASLREEIKVHNGFRWLYLESIMDKDSEDLVIKNYDPEKPFRSYSSPTSKSIVQLDTRGNFIQKYSSISEASQKLREEGKLKSLKASSSIGQCCKAHSDSFPNQNSPKTSFKYIWMFEPDYEKWKDKGGKTINLSNRLFINIVQMDLNENPIKIWQNPKEIEEVLGFDRSSIVKCCKGKAKTHKGFIWKYLSDVNEDKIKQIN